MDRRIDRRRAGRWALIGALAVVTTFGLLMVPGKEAPVRLETSQARFTWNEDSLWPRLEADFNARRRGDCSAPIIEGKLDDLERAGQALRRSPAEPDAPEWARLERLVFEAAVVAAACPTHLAKLSDLELATRVAIREASRNWPTMGPARDQLYRLLQGLRVAHEHALLQAADTARPLESFVEVAVPQESSRTPSSIVHGVPLHSGDLLLSRGNAPTSALIARGNARPGSFSHVAVVYIPETGADPWVVEAHIEQGSVVATAEQYLEDAKLRVLVLRPRSDEPALIANPRLPHQAARRIFERVRRQHIPYDFSMDFRDDSKLFCSEVASSAYTQVGLDLWRVPSELAGPGLQGWLWSLGVRHFLTEAPSDLEYDPQLAVVAEWRDVEGLARANVDDALVDAMLERANQAAVDGSEAGATAIPPPLPHRPLLLPLVRLAKGVSVLLNAAGRVGPIPEGMDAMAAARTATFNAWHEQVADRLFARAQQYRQERGYWPPYWTLLAWSQAELESPNSP